MVKWIYGSNHLWQNEIRLQTTYSKTGCAVLVCVPNQLCTTLADVIQICGNSNEWMELRTNNLFLSSNHLPTTYQPTTYRPSTDHLPTIYRPPTDQFFMVQLVHNYPLQLDKQTNKQTKADRWIGKQTDRYKNTYSTHVKQHNRFLSHKKRTDW